MDLPPISTLCSVTDCSALGGSAAAFLGSSPAGLSAARAPAAPVSMAAIVAIVAIVAILAIIRQGSILFTSPSSNGVQASAERPPWGGVSSRYGRRRPLLHRSAGEACDSGPAGAWGAGSGGSVDTGPDGSVGRGQLPLPPGARQTRGRGGAPYSVDRDRHEGNRVAVRIGGGAGDVAAVVDRVGD